MATPKKQQPAPRTRTRKEVKEDFEALKEAVEDTAPADPKTAQVAKARAQTVQTKVAQVTPEAVVGQIGQVTLDIQKTLADVQGQILDKLNVLGDLNEAIVVKQAEIERLHNLDTAQCGIDALIQEYEEKRVALEKEYAERSQTLEVEHAARVTEEARAAADSQAAREREEADYVYKTRLVRRKAEDEFAQKQALLERQLQERKEVLEKGWADREEKLKAAEKELADLRAAVATLPETIRKERDAGIAIATNSLKKDLTAEFNLAKKDLEQAIALARQQAAALQAQNDTYAKRVAQLEGDVAAARSEVKDMALASFREAGAAKALTEVTALASRESNSNTRSKS